MGGPCSFFVQKFQLPGARNIMSRTARDCSIECIRMHERSVLRKSRSKLSTIALNIESWEQKSGNVAESVIDS